MTAQIDILAARLTALEDRQAIHDLIALYGPLADAGKAQAVAELWTRDGIYDVIGFGTATGHAQIAELIEGPVHAALLADGCAHVLGPVALTLDGDRAIALGHSVVFRRTPSNAQGEPARFEVYRISANRWTLQRTQQGWRVSHRSNALLDGAEAARALLRPGAQIQPAS